MWSRSRPEGRDINPHQTTKESTKTTEERPDFGRFRVRLSLQKGSPKGDHLQVGTRCLICRITGVCGLSGVSGRSRGSSRRCLAAQRNASCSWPSVAPGSASTKYFCRVRSTCVFAKCLGKGLKSIKTSRLSAYRLISITNMEIDLDSLFISSHRAMFSFLGLRILALSASARSASPQSYWPTGPAPLKEHFLGREIQGPSQSDFKISA